MIGTAMYGNGWDTAETIAANREYAQRLEDTSDAYAKAAMAPGLRKDAAEYLRSESRRLYGEAEHWRTTAAEAEAALEARLNADWRDTYTGPCPYTVGKRTCKAGDFRHAGPHDWDSAPIASGALLFGDSV